MFNITDHTPQPYVIYFGTLINVPIGINYLVTDSRGYVLGFTIEPFVFLSSNEWTSRSGRPIILTTVQFDGDWKQSLMKIPN
jgi:hypothetical protein